MIVEFVATRHGGDRLLGTEEFRQVVLALGETRVVSLKEKSDSHASKRNQTATTSYVS